MVNIVCFLLGGRALIGPSGVDWTDVGTMASLLLSPAQRRVHKPDRSVAQKRRLAGAPCVDSLPFAAQKPFSPMLIAG
jgi:hypothetical protein